MGLKPEYFFPSFCLESGLCKQLLAPAAKGHCVSHQGFLHTCPSQSEPALTEYCQHTATSPALGEGKLGVALESLQGRRDLT